MLYPPFYPAAFTKGWVLPILPAIDLFNGHSLKTLVQLEPLGFVPEGLFEV